MKRCITRRYEISRDELKLAALAWLQDQMDFPVPARPDAASFLIDKNGDCVIAWTEEIDQ